MDCCTGIDTKRVFIREYAQPPILPLHYRPISQGRIQDFSKGGGGGLHLNNLNLAKEMVPLNPQLFLLIIA